MVIELKLAAVVRSSQPLVALATELGTTTSDAAHVLFSARTAGREANASFSGLHAPVPPCQQLRKELRPAAHADVMEHPVRPC